MFRFSVLRLLFHDVYSPARQDLCPLVVSEHRARRDVHGRRWHAPRARAYRHIAQPLQAEVRAASLLLLKRDGEAARVYAAQALRDRVTSAGRLLRRHLHGPR